ncbi:MAG TPA: hypothetical protein VN679_09575 [Candidatus Acidoferrales bacterium]|jgi:hypothetical protein|nr:hypothetical protein [Candidatus Acidoferrales bacterium]
MSTETDAEKMLDKTLADTFPASDPLSTLPNPAFDSFGSQTRGTKHQDAPKTTRKIEPEERKSA